MQQGHGPESPDRGEGEPSREPGSGPASSEEPGESGSPSPEGPEAAPDEGEPRPEERPHSAPGPPDSLRLAVGDPAWQAHPPGPPAPEPPPAEPPPEDEPPSWASGEAQPAPPTAGRSGEPSGNRFPGQRGPWLAAGLAVIVVLALSGAGAFTYLTLRDGSSQALAPAGPPDQQGPPEADQPAASPEFDRSRIRDIRTDSRPLTLGEQFPEKTLTTKAGRTFERVATDLAQDCTAAARGGFGKVLQDAGCRRVLRGTFTGSDGPYAATVGVAVLPTAQQAKRVASAAKSHQAGWFTPLSGPGAEGIDSSGGYSFLATKGHYAMFCFATHTNSTDAPSNAEDLQKVGKALLEYASYPILQRAVVHSGQS